MRVASAEAPWVHTGFERVRADGLAVGQRTVGTRSTSTGTRSVAEGDEQGDTDEADRSRNANQSRAASADLDAIKREYERKIDGLNRKIEDLDNKSIDYERKMKDCEDLKRCLQQCLQSHPLTNADRSILNNGIRDPYEGERPTPVMRVAPPIPDPDEAKNRMRSPLQPASYAEAYHPIPESQQIRRLPSTIQDAIPLPVPINRSAARRMAKPSPTK